MVAVLTMKRKLDGALLDFEFAEMAIEEEGHVVGANR